MLQIWHQIMGVFCLIVGLVLLPLPIPFGLILIVVGLTLLTPYMPFVQGMVRSLRRRNETVNRKLMEWREHFPPVIQKAIDKTHP